MAGLHDRFRLRFADPGEETAFRNFYCLRLRHHTSLALAAGALLIGLFAVSDWMLDPAGARVTVALRLLVVVPAMLAFAWAVGQPWIERVYESAATLVACLVATLLAVIYVRID